MAEARLKLATLNTWGRTGPWPARRAAIRAELARLAPDVVGLQEVWDGDGGNLADELLADDGTWHVQYARAYELSPGVFCGNAIASRHPIVDRAAWPLPEPPGDTGRNLVHAMIATPWGRLPVFVTHFSWLFHQSRARLTQARHVAARLRERAPIQRGDAPTDELPPVVMGDLNAPPDADELRFLRGLLAAPALPGEPEGDCYLADCFAIRGTGAGHTFHRSNPFAAREHYPNRRIDYILVRGPDRWHRGEPLVAQVAFDQPDDDGVFPSDHFGVYAEVRATPVTLPPL
ncbi:MAG: endonuclease/exonuclease/phosphatase family protein [Myxococcales bacterium]|nr:endonuclease/exonuclease/phosphatase family protein [Myxococcales bacterium]